MTRWIYFFLIFCINSILTGEIITTNDFNRIEKECNEIGKKSLVLFDVDGTLIVPDDAILQSKGRPLFKQLTERYTDRDLFREIRMVAPHSLVDQRSVELVEKLQKKQIPVIAFTAAPAKIQGEVQLGNWRVNELKKYGFDFSGTFPNDQYVELQQSLNQPFLPLYKLGVLYSSFHPKGEILIAFLRKLNLKPKKIIFIDDELVHVQSVMACLEREGIENICIHYTAANEIPCDLNSEQALFQVRYFIKHNIWLSDTQLHDSSDDFF